VALVSSGNKGHSIGSTAMRTLPPPAPKAVRPNVAPIGLPGSQQPQARQESLDAVGRPVASVNSITLSERFHRPKTKPFRRTWPKTLEVLRGGRGYQLPVSSGVLWLEHSLLGLHVCRVVGTIYRSVYFYGPALGAIGASGVPGFHRRILSAGRSMSHQLATASGIVHSTLMVKNSA